jgi:hypothetical protein
MYYRRLIGATGLAFLLFTSLGCDDGAPGADADAVLDVPVLADTVTLPDADVAVTPDVAADGEVTTGPTGCPPPGCDDGNVCTADECDAATQTCKHTSLTDGTACGCGDSGQCFAGTCVNGQGVCNTNADCDDAFACTYDRCDGCQCVVEAIPDCVE